MPTSISRCTAVRVSAGVAGGGPWTEADPASAPPVGTVEDAARDEGCRPCIRTTAMAAATIDRNSSARARWAQRLRAALADRPPAQVVATDPGRRDGTAAAGRWDERAGGRTARLPGTGRGDGMPGARCY